MDDLWAPQRSRRLDQVRPLADRRRPRSLDAVVGQDHLLGPEALLRRMIHADRMGSILLWGPPGTGKTTVASLIAGQTGRPFVSTNASMVGVKDIREIIDTSRRDIEQGRPATILFLDEIHRFARNQQDVLLGDVERGVLTLIGATTENPWYAVNPALASRSTVFQLEPLNEEDIIEILRRALAEDALLRARKPTVANEALAFWATRCDGDARRALNALEIAVLGSQHETAAVIDTDQAAQSIQAKGLRYDVNAHYDHASALIKSIRGSDPDAALHWLAVMLTGGEDPRFICRRMAIFASEDIGLASPQALQMAAAAWTITERVGMPECQLTLSELVLYLATCPKSRTATTAIEAAMEDVRTTRSQPVPEHLRSGGDHTHPEGKQPPAAPGFMTTPKVYYHPSDSGFEAEISKRLKDSP